LIGLKCKDIPEGKLKDEFSGLAACPHFYRSFFVIELIINVFINAINPPIFTILFLSKISKGSFNFPHRMLKNQHLQWQCGFAAKSTFLGMNVSIIIRMYEGRGNIFVLRLTIR